MMGGQKEPLEEEIENGFLDNKSSNYDADVETKANSKKYLCCKSLWRIWIRCCQSINVFFEKIFTKLAFKIATNPNIVILLCVLLPVLLLLGFARYKIIERSEDLYLPQDSQAMKDLERSEKNFQTSMKLEEFTIKQKHDSWILKDDIFEIALEIHQRIISLPGFEDICIKDGKGNCLISSPLEVLHYNGTLIRNVTTALTLGYIDQSRILQNGRQPFMSYAEYFGNFQFDSQFRHIKRADALRNVYFVYDPVNKELYEKLVAFETNYIEYMENMAKRLENRNLILLYNSARGIDISLSDSASKDIKLVSVSLFLMVLFCAFVLTRFKNQVIGHFILGVGGLLTLFLGIGSAFGSLMLVGAPYVAFAGVLPFLVLGVGIDNMFIIIDALDRQDHKLTGPERIAKAVGGVGASITMTTLTDLVAFFVSMVTDFPAIRYFCMYAAVSITFCYLLVITLFLAFLTHDVKRVEERRKDLMPCVVDENMKEDEVWVDGKETVSNKIMTSYAKILMKKPLQYIVLVCSFLLLGFGVWGAINIDQSFDLLVVGLEDSAYVKYFTYYNQAYPTGQPTSIIIDTEVNYGDSNIQRKYSELDQIGLENKYTKDEVINWMTSFIKWSHVLKVNITTEQNFYLHLKQFLAIYPQFYADLRFSNTTGKLVASRMLMFTQDNTHSIFRRDGMLSIRKDLKEKSTLPVYAINYFFTYIEQFVVILPDTIRNLVICAFAILLITLPYLVSPKVTFFVFFGFVSLMFELLGMMYLWEVSLNGISMIVIIMGIGFAVDYSAHTAHAFIISNKKTPEARVIYALKTMGSSVSMGGFSTFVGVTITAFASSEIFKIFFKMVLGIVVLGLLHGLLFLPTHLAVFCRSKVSIKTTEEIEGEKLNGEESTLMKRDEFQKEQI